MSEVKYPESLYCWPGRSEFMYKNRVRGKHNYFNKYKGYNSSKDCDRVFVGIFVRSACLTTRTELSFQDGGCVNTADLNIYINLLCSQWSRTLKGLAHKRPVKPKSPQVQLKLERIRANVNKHYSHQ